MAEAFADLRGRVGGLIARGADPRKIDAARAELKTAVLTQHIREAVASWPPLTDQVRAELALLLTGADGDAA